MAEYIKLEPLREEIFNDDFDCDIINHFLNIVDSQPTADVVEVVRCKDCMWWYPREYGSVIGRCENPYNGLATEYIEEDEFCSYGKRKEGAEE